MFKNAIKKDLRLIATELNETVTEKMTVADLNALISNNTLFKSNPDQVITIANSIIEERRGDETRQVELEKIKLERVKAELELQKLKIDTKSEVSRKDSEPCSVEMIIKSIRTLTLKLPSKPEGWGLFFSSLERAFVTKSVPDTLKAEILLNLLGERASNIITYLKDDEIEDYEKVKLIILREFEPTPQACLEQFQKATRQQGETCVQFASRLITSYDYYLKLRKVSDFDTLKQLIVADKIFQTLDREVASHINIREENSWFNPLKLAQEVDLYLTSRGKQSENYYVSRRNQNSKHVSKVFFSDVKGSKCIVCTEFHPLYKCPEYKKLSVNERVKVVKNNNLCFNCLSFHKVAECKSKYRCSICSKSHHITLHFLQGKNAVENSNKNSEIKRSTAEIAIKRNENVENTQLRQNLSPFSAEFVPVTAPETESAINAGRLFTTRIYNDQSKTVLLSTAICLVRDSNGKVHKLRCLLDSGSMCNLLSLSFAEKLGLRKEKINRVLSGLNDVSMSVRSRVNTTLSNTDMSFQTNLDFLIIPRITEFIPCEKIKINKQKFGSIKLADENFDIPGNIDALLGAEVFYEILIPGQIYPVDTRLILQNTVFGYIVSGNVQTSDANKIHCGFVKEHNDLDNILRSFWEIENVESNPVKSKETIICEEHFLESHARDKTGKYVVKMPLKEDPSCLGKSRDIAVRKLNSLWNKLKRDSDYLNLYKHFLAEYKEMGHMIEIADNEEQGTYFIPHLGVYRPENNTTPLRVVFNASSPTSSGISLNSIQYNGGVPQDDLLSIMIRFRIHIFAFTADVTKMYRMIWIHPEQRKLQRIVWKEGIDEPIKTFELSTVTYGTTSAPFLATRTLKQLAIDEASEFPLAAEVVMNNMYVDDVLSGAQTLSEAKELQNQLIGIFKKAGMSLHKWRSNTKSLVQTKEEKYSFANSEESKTLGVFWNQCADSFTFHVKADCESYHTKRDVLSTIARVFDPLGLVGPAITRAKIMLQKLWLLKIEWHNLLPSKEEQEWKRFIESLQHLNSLSIGRCIVLQNPEVIELHGYSDASQVAYGAVVYCKSTSEGKVLVKLISSKSRVSPIKQTTIPRLELCGALLLAKLVRKVKSSLPFDIPCTFYWCDSMIVLSWIKKEPHLLKTFVSNRVSRIQELTDVSQWRHVSSSDNPADKLSRGMDPQDLDDCSLWWNGPEYLATDNYPNRVIPEAIIKDDYASELKNSSDSNCINLSILTDDFVNNLLHITNKYFKIVRIMSFIFRFLDGCKKERKTGPLEASELKKAELHLVKLVQKHCFSEEIDSVKAFKRGSKIRALNNLNPFVDKNGILRVGGRISNSNLSYDKKFPILLPAKHRLTDLIVNYFHLKYLHSGPQALLHQIRQQFWILNGRNVCRKIVHNCIKCFRAKPLVVNQQMADLPQERVTKAFPFSITGADFCGPFYIKYRGQRKGIYHKIYICVFICFVSKAMHLEIVSDMTSAAFIAALKRFIFRRGKCAKLFTDNAKNFVGANADLKKLQKLVKQPDETLADYLSSENIDWKFLPPRAPNFGGIWEAGVKSIKYYLKRVVGNMKLTYEEFLTVVVQIEGMLNSRPLVPLSADIDDLNVLTPSHFLIGRPITSIVEPDLTNIGENRLDHWKNLTKIMQIIWKKWSSDYLSNLQQRHKWKFEKNNVKVGDLVIVKEDNLPPCQWSVGRISEIYPGKDLKVRVVQVKTALGEYKRPISKLCLLPMP